jgi:hypothetical protein
MQTRPRAHLLKRTLSHRVEKVLTFIAQVYALLRWRSGSFGLGVSDEDSVDFESKRASHIIIPMDTQPWSLLLSKSMIGKHGADLFSWRLNRTIRWSHCSSCDKLHSGQKPPSVVVATCDRSLFVINELLNSEISEYQCTGYRFCGLWLRPRQHFFWNRNFTPRSFIPEVSPDTTLARETLFASNLG